MNITLKNLRFVHYNPDDDSRTDVRPLTEQETKDFWEFFVERSANDFADEVLIFAEERTNGEATDVDWEELIFEEAS